MPVTKERIYTVSELTKDVKLALEGSFGAVWVEGEISNFTYHSSGHMYLSLKDSRSVLRCAMFKRANDALKFKPKDGMQVVCFGNISVYELRGEYQLIIEKMEPKGIGALQIAFQQLKEKLSKEGLFDSAHKVPIPFLPTRIGVVTSPTGAAIRDILNVLSRRFVNVNVMLYPVLVQGEGAAGQIAQAIRDFNMVSALSDGKIPEPDVLIVGRGGGSLEDLWAFNEEEVARAIYDSRIPVISAVGHEIDWTISDFVADLRAATPSAAAELVVARKEELIEKIQSGRERLDAAISAFLDLACSRLSNLKDAYVLRQPLNVLTQYQQRIDELTKTMCIKAEHYMQMCNQTFKAAVGRLEALSPLAILSRGYSITKRSSDEKIIKEASQVSPGDEIITRLHKGQIKSKVEAAQ
jgi:exodeoxyribonuclease VII large subunit